MSEVDPQAFTSNTVFTDSLPGWRRRKLEGYLSGGLFISHSSSDYPSRFYQEPQSKIEKIVDIIVPRFGPNGYFLHSLKSGGAEVYRELVNIALSCCDKFLLLVSAGSVRSPWVSAEVQFALVNQRPIIEACLDGTHVEQLYNGLPADLFHNYHSARSSIDFHSNVDQGREMLAQLLDQLLARFPYPCKQMD